MENRKIQSKKRYFVAFLIGTFLFISIFILSYSLSYFEFGRISNLQENIAYKIFEDKLDYSLFNNKICSNESFKKVSEDLGFQGRIIDDLEKKFGKNNRAVLFRKKFYTLIELEHLEFVNLLNEKCGLNINTILFFYSNKKDELDRSDEVGRLLGTVYNRNPDLVIYSFDIDLDTELISKLKEKFDIEISPTVIINDNITIVNPLNINEIEKYLV